MGNHKFIVCPKHGDTKHFITQRGDVVCSKCSSEKVSKHRQDMKRTLVELLGGECQICGYNKCSRSLQFHHLDKAKKQYTIGSYSALARSTAAEEAKKCILVCANCHGEIECGVTHCHQEPNQEVVNRIALYIEQLATKANKSPAVCSWCNVEFFGSCSHQKFCSPKCACLAKRKYRPAKDTLESLLQTYTWTDLGRKYGVSGNAVKKWAKGYGLV